MRAHHQPAAAAAAAAAAGARATWAALQERPQLLCAAAHPSLQTIWLSGTGVQGQLATQSALVAGLLGHCC
jgi:hypothetical protein